MSTSPTDESSLGDLLVRSRLITPSQLAEAQRRIQQETVAKPIPLSPAIVPDDQAMTVPFKDPRRGTVMASVKLGEPADITDWPRWTDGRILVISLDGGSIEDAVVPPQGVRPGLFVTPQGGFLALAGLPQRATSPAVLHLPSPFHPQAPAAQGPIDLATSPGGEFLLAANRGSGSVHIVAAASGTQVSAVSIRPAGNRRGIGMAVLGRQAWVTDAHSPRLGIVDLTTGKVRFQSFPTGPLGPLGLSPDGQLLHVLFYRTGDDLGLLTVSTTDLRVRHLLNLPGKRSSMAPLEPLRISPDGQRLNVVVQEGTQPDRHRLLTVDLARRKLEKDVPLERLPLTLAHPPVREWLPSTPSLAETLITIGAITRNELLRLKDADPDAGPLDDPRVDPLVVAQLPERMVRSLGMVPLFREDGKLVVAMIDPRDPTGLQLASQLAGGAEPAPVGVTEDQIAGFLTHRYPQLLEQAAALRAGQTTAEPAEPRESTPEPAAESEALTDAAPVSPPTWGTVGQEESLVAQTPLLGAVSTETWVGLESGEVLLADPPRRRVVRLDASGREIWMHRLPMPALAREVPGGNVLLVDMELGRVIEFDRRNQTEAWGYGGGDAERLRQPRHASRLADGHTLIVDTGQHRILEVTPDRKVVWAYGETGKAGVARGLLFKPMAALRREDGVTVILDTGNHRILGVDRSGTVLWQYGNASNRLGGGQGSGAGLLNDPQGMSLLPDGSLLVCDTGNQRVIELDANRQIRWAHRIPPVRGGAVARDPYAAARDAGNRTWIAGRSGVMCVESDGRLAHEFTLGAPSPTVELPASPGGPPTAAQAEVPVPEGRESPLPVNMPETLLFADRQRHRILEVDRKMQVVWQYTGLSGGERQRLAQPRFGWRTPQGGTLVADTGHHRILEIRDNAIVWQFGKLGERGSGPKQLDEPASVERTPQGTFLVADMGNRRVLEVNVGQEIIWRKDNLMAPSHATRLPGGHVLVTDWGGHVVYEFDAQGRTVWAFGQPGNAGQAHGQLFHPEHATRLTNGHTLIADTQNHRVLEIDPTGKRVWQYGGEAAYYGRKGRFQMQMLTPVLAFRLESGRTMVHHAGANHLVEVDPQHNLTWHFQLV
ncbi:MAG: PQQ-binding-like beta-propeller repeat protein [Candidatus Sericytochromatia bacterium]|nr:PQQ-binding-like beta-propeller repeat protein [Candidatus Sericytochromatia bacterium]